MLFWLMEKSVKVRYWKLLVPRLSYRFSKVLTVLMSRRLMLSLLEVFSRWPSPRKCLEDPSMDLVNQSIKVHQYLLNNSEIFKVNQLTPIIVFIQEKWSRLVSPLLMSWTPLPEDKKSLFSPETVSHITRSVPRSPDKLVLSTVVREQLMNPPKISLLSSLLWV